MKNSKVILSLAMICTLVTAVLKAEELTVPLSRPGEPAILVIDSPYATVTVEAFDGDTMVFHMVEGTGSAGHRHGHSDDKKSGLTRIPSRVGYTIEELDNKVELEMEGFMSSFTVKVKVPVNTSLKLETANGGAMVISGVNGDHELQNANGGIYARDISGSAVAETSNGEVEVSFASVKANTPMAFSTVNGNVDVTFPASFAADLRIDPGRGETYTDFDMQVEDGGTPVQRKMKNGGNMIEVQKEIRGSLNGGGSVVRFETFNGSVYIRKGN